MEHAALNTAGDDTNTATNPAAANAAPADTWQWEPASPSEIPSDPAPAPSLSEIEAALGTGPALDDYLNLALVGITGLALAILLTRPRR